MAEMARPLSIVSFSFDMLNSDVAVGDNVVVGFSTVVVAAVVVLVGSSPTAVDGVSLIVVSRTSGRGGTCDRVDLFVGFALNIELENLLV